MEVEELREICRSFPGVTEDIKWEDHLCFNIGGKMFCVTGPDEFPVTASFKASDEDFETLTSREGFSPAAYLARYKWVYTDDIRHLNRREWEYYLAQAYELIRSKLPKKVQQALVNAPNS